MFFEKCKNYYIVDYANLGDGLPVVVYDDGVCSSVKKCCIVFTLREVLVLPLLLFSFVKIAHVVETQVFGTVVELA